MTKKNKKQYPPKAEKKEKGLSCLMENDRLSPLLTTYQDLKKTWSLSELSVAAFQIFKQKENDSVGMIFRNFPPSEEITSSVRGSNSVIIFPYLIILNLSEGSR